MGASKSKNRFICWVGIMGLLAGCGTYQPDNPSALLNQTPSATTTTYAVMEAHNAKDYEFITTELTRCDGLEYAYVGTDGEDYVTICKTKAAGYVYRGVIGGGFMEMPAVEVDSNSAKKQYQYSVDCGARSIRISNNLVTISASVSLKTLDLITLTSWKHEDEQ